MQRRFRIGCDGRRIGWVGTRRRRLGARPGAGIGDLPPIGETEYAGPVTCLDAPVRRPRDPAGASGRPGPAARRPGRARLEPSRRLHAVLGLSLAGGLPAGRGGGGGGIAVACRAGPTADALEIGCGLGLAGLVALRAGCGSSSPITIGRRWISSARSRGRERIRSERGIATRLLDWRDLPDERFPVILGADVTLRGPAGAPGGRRAPAMLAPGGVG